MSIKAGFVWMFLGLVTLAGFGAGHFGGLNGELICLPAVIAVIVGGIIGFVQVFDQ